MLIKEKNERDYWHNFFRTVMASLEEILITADVADNLIEYISPNAEQILGIRQEQPGAATDLLRRIGLLEEQDLSALKEREERESERYLLNLQTGETQWCRCCWNFLQGYSDTREKLIINIADRSRERASMDRISRDLQEARRTSAAKSRFLTTLSHDIRTPMNAIMGLTDLAMEQQGQQEKVQEYLLKISKASAHLLELINDVLDMSRIESGRMTLEAREFSFHQLLEDILDLIRPQSQGKKQKLTTDWNLQHDRVSGDPIRIRQILLNILSNAVKYTQRGGSVFFQVNEEMNWTQGGRSYGRYRIQVYDNGYGMSETFQQIIFEPFAKEQTADKAGIEGTGLGMAITKNLVDLMGGSLSVESRLGEGTLFVVQLPLQVGAADKRSKVPLSGRSAPVLHMECGSAGMRAEKADRGVSCRGRRVLLVEDNEISAEVLADILTLMGAKVRRADNGRQAVEMFSKARNEFDLILMDIQMPVMDGYEATRRIRGMSAAGRQVPIIALTGNAFTEDIEASRSAGMDGHLAKPVKKQELEAVLQRVFEEKTAT